MLKLNYSDLGLSVERFVGTLEDWIADRALLAMRSGVPFIVEPGRASFLVATTHPLLDHLWVVAENLSSVEIDRADAEYIEVSLQGVWVSQSLDACEGTLVCVLSEDAEKAIDRLWALDRSVKTPLR